MSRFEILDTEANNFFDVVVEVGFQNQLRPSEVIKILQLIIEASSGRITSKLYDGLSFLEINESLLMIQFRVSKETNPPTNVDGITGEDLSRLRAQFIFYLFAKIDSQYPLADVPFPENFRMFINLPEYYGN